MARKGPKPQPTYLKVVRGNPGKRPLNRNEPQPRTVTRAPPAPASLKLDDQAVRQWRRVCRRLARMGHLGDVDLDAVEQFCFFYGRWFAAAVKCHAEGDVIETVNGNVVQNPYTAIARKSSEMLLRYMVELGLTPSSRSRVEMLKKATDDDDLFD